MSANNVVVAFDLYGTLLSTESIAKELAKHFGQENSQKLAALWRRYQLEYSWRLTSMDRYDTFSNITHASLKHALAEMKLSLPESSIASLMKCYDSLSPFPDVPPALKTLSSKSNLTCVVFTNGTSDMANASVMKSPGLSPLASTFKDIVTVDAVRKFKPAPAVYHYLAQRVGKQTTEMETMWLISGNPFDVVGARATGMNAIWVDRAGNGWVDSLVDREKGPTAIVSSLEKVPEVLEQQRK